jgi:hypothetical protein
MSAIGRLSLSILAVLTVSDLQTPLLREIKLYHGRSIDVFGCP